MKWVFFSSEVQGMLLKDIYSVTNDDHLMRFLVQKYGEVLCQKKKTKQTKTNKKQLVVCLRRLAFYMNVRKAKK